MFGIGGGELAAIALVALLVFGPKQIPIIMRNLKSLQQEYTRLRRDMNSTINEVRREIDLVTDLDDKQPPPKTDKPQGATPQGKVEPAKAAAPAVQAQAEPTAKPQQLDPEQLDDYLAVPATANDDDYLAEGADGH